MTTRTTVVVPVRNRLALTQQCVEAFAAEYGDRDDVELVVVDDGSTDETTAYLEQAPGLRLVQHAESAGFAASCNDGAAAGSGDYIVFLNNDTLGEEGWLDGLVSFADGNDKAAIVGARLLYENGTIQHAGIVFGADLLPRHVYRTFPREHPAVSRSRRFQAVDGGVHARDAQCVRGDRWLRHRFHERLRRRGSVPSCGRPAVRRTTTPTASSSTKRRRREVTTPASSAGTPSAT